MEYGPKHQEIMKTVEDNIAADLYRRLRGTDLAKDALCRCPHIEIEQLAKELAAFTMADKPGRFIDVLQRSSEHPIPDFEKTAQRAVERAFLRCFKEYKLEVKNGSNTD